MTLLQTQQAFAAAIPALIAKALSLGFQVTLGDAYRDPRLHGTMGERKGYGSANSCHKLRLAIDLNLFRDGRFLQHTDDHRQLGEWWETQHPLARWGGRFNDGNHYSFEWQGYK